MLKDSRWRRSRGGCSTQLASGLLAVTAGQLACDGIPEAERLENDPEGIETVVRKACRIHDVASRPGGGRTFALPRRRPHDGRTRERVARVLDRWRTGPHRPAPGGRCAPWSGGPASAGPGPR